ncbi:MAG: hypothetical protein ACR2OZ_09575 [Verrucomicrobiales bacterium]
MTVSEIRLSERDNHWELTAQLACDTGWILDRKPFGLWYRFPFENREWLDCENADPFLAACLAPAMCLGESLIIEGLVSPKLLKAVPEIQTILRSWNPALSEVMVSIGTRTTPGASSSTPSNAGLFFSLGVDSAYSLAKNMTRYRTGDEALTELITVFGFDVYLSEAERFPPMIGNVRRVAETYGKDVLSVSTNLREFSDKIVDWVSQYHGAGLASVALALGAKFNRVLIAATHTYSHLLPLGSHPLLDPLWSTETLTFVHDGCEADRLTKIRAISHFPHLLKLLRICATGEVTDEYNCGRCPKCLMTMIGLRIAGVLEQCETLPHTIDLAKVRNMPVKNSTQRMYIEQLIEALDASGDQISLRCALHDCLAASKRVQG